MEIPDWAEELPDSTEVEVPVHFFDPWLTLESQMIAMIEKYVTPAILEKAQPRRRARKGHDLENLRNIIVAVYANLAYVLVLTGGSDFATVVIPLAKPKGKQSRYDRKSFRQLPAVLELFRRRGLLQLKKSKERGRASWIEPTSTFREEWIPRSWFPTWESFRRAAGEEVIILSRTETDHSAGTRIADRKQYSDTADTRRYRSEIERINAALVAADLRYAGLEREIDLQRRTLRRVFNIPMWMPERTVRFDLGGRLYGGWWQNLSEDRRALIRIDGEPIADLDFKSMFPHLAYVHVRKPVPAGDPYALPGFKGYRDGVKRTFNAMLFRNEPLRRIPRGCRELLPPGCNGEKIRTAILDRHQGLGRLFENGAGFNLMFLESQILVAILLRLIDLKIAALPMHDGLMVAESKARAATKVMGDVAEELTKAEKLTGRRLQVVPKSGPSNAPRSL